MSVSTAIGMVSESLKTLLEEEMSVNPVAPVTLLAPDEPGGNRRINLFLYKVQENNFLKNKDWEVSRTDPARIVPPPLSLNLYYLLTPYAQNDPESGNSSTHEILGDAMRVLYQFPVIPGEHLAVGLTGAREQIKIMQLPVDLDEISKVWSTFSTPYRLSVAYEVSTVQLDPLDGAQDMPTRVRAIGVPDVSAPFAPPKILALAPAAGPAGGTITVSGEQLDGWKAYVDFDGVRIVDGLAIAGNSFDVTVPPATATGFHRLRIDISRLHRSTFYFEVTP
jgi:hypothetical protein